MPQLLDEFPDRFDWFLISLLGLGGSLPVEPLFVCPIDQESLEEMLHQTGLAEIMYKEHGTTQLLDYSPNILDHARLLSSAGLVIELPLHPVAPDIMYLVKHRSELQTARFNDLLPMVTSIWLYDRFGVCCQAQPESSLYYLVETEPISIPFLKQSFDRILRETGR